MIEDKGLCGCCGCVVYDTDRYIETETDLFCSAECKEKKESGDAGCYREQQ